MAFDQVSPDSGRKSLGICPNLCLSFVGHSLGAGEKGRVSTFSRRTWINRLDTLTTLHCNYKLCAVRICKNAPLHTHLQKNNMGNNVGGLLIVSVGTGCCAVAL